MLKGEWSINTNYERGDIVTLFKIHYYVCVMNHTSDELVNPRNPEEIYWIELIDMYPHDSSNGFSPQPQLESIRIPSLITPMPPPVLKRRLRQQEEEDEDEKKEEDNKKNTLQIKLKRKLKNIEEEMITFKKKRKFEDSTLDLKKQIMLLNVDIETKIFLLEKYESIQNLGNSDYAKGKTWLKTVLNIPFGKYKSFKVKASDNSDKINDYFKMVREHLDKKVHNMDKVKDEIMEFLARKISNPHSKGHILALCGPPGCGKTVILKSLAEALELPFYQVNFGGLNDVSVLTGHSETYVGSKSGKFVEILTSAGCMNPIIYLDEIDKISEYKSREINGILTHLLDEEQNNKFQDNYLSNININLSRALFVIAFNDFDKVDKIVSDRMKVIYIECPTSDSKVTIASEKMIPDIINMLNIKKDKFINLDNELLKYIIESKVPKEDGVRQLRKSLEKLFNRINYLFLTGQYNDSNLTITKSNSIYNDTQINLINDNLCLLNIKDTVVETVHITKQFIDCCLDSHADNTSYSHMYV
jgi:ATP-dependent Lon protease